jgi:carboxyl-terminal processing protease
MLVRRLVLAILVVGLGLSAPAETGGQRLLDQAIGLVEARFYDPRAFDEGWRERVARARARVARGQADAHEALRDLLASLRTSHTALFTRRDTFYYLLASTFGERAPGFEGAFPSREVKMADPGFFAQPTGQGVFVCWVLEGGPADQAGIRVGDEIVSVEGSPWRDVDSFRGREGRPVRLDLRRQAGGPVRSVRLVPRLINPQDAFLEAMHSSARVFERGGKRVGYVHVWAFTDDRVYERYFQVLQERFGACQGLVLDLREGIGGGDLDRQWSMVADLPRVFFTDRQAQTFLAAGGGWRGPLVALINERSRSGKEIFSYALQSRHRALLVGTPTAGAVTGGSAYYLDDHSLLYLATVSVEVEGHNLEGRGVQPDVRVERPIPYSQGADPQLERALEVLFERL